MKNIFATGLVLACFAAAGTASVKAAPAIYREGMLEIPEGIMIDEAGDHYFRNIKLRTEANGALRIVRAQPRKLITLEELELNQVYGDVPTVELLVKGYKSMPCTSLEPVAVRRVNYTFHVLVAESGPDPLALCAQMLDPVELTIELDVTGLPPGEYEARVNNEPMEFTLEDLGE